MNLLPNLLRRHAARQPGAPCLTFGSERLSYRDMDDRSNRVANAFIREGVRPGDRIALIGRNLPAHY